MKPWVGPFVLGFAVAFLVGISVPSTANVAQHMIAPMWLVNPTIRVDSTMPAPFDTSTAKNQIAVSVLEWNWVSNTNLNLIGGTQLHIANNASVGSVPDGFIWFTDEPMAGSLFGEAFLRYKGPGGLQIAAGLVELNQNMTAASWYTSAGQTQPVGTLDLRSASSHELGHTLGFRGGVNHVNVGCTSRATANTMCAGHIPAFSGNQATEYRTLETHETTDYATKY